MSDRYTLDELRDLLAEQLPSALPAEVARAARVVVLLLRPGLATAPARTPVKRRQHPPEKPAAERLKLKR